MLGITFFFELIFELGSSFFINLDHKDWISRLKEPVEIASTSKAIVDHCIYLAKSEEPFKGEKLIMEILVEEENTIIDIALRSDDLIPTLATSLPVLEEAEEYEYCQKIVDTINLLSN